MCDLDPKVKGKGQIMHFLVNASVSARPEFLGVIDDPLCENLGVIGKLRGSELFKCIFTFCLSMRQY